MQNIESAEMASFKVMILVADKLAETGVAQLLLECYDEARDDNILFKEISANYLYRKITLCCYVFIFKHLPLRLEKESINH